MKQFLTLIIVLVGLFGLGAGAVDVMNALTHHEPAEPTPVEKTVAELRAQVGELRAQGAELRAQKASADEAQQSHEEDNAKSLDELKARANQAIDHLEQTIQSLGHPQDHSILTEDEQRAKFAADYPVIAKQLEQPTSCPLPEVGKADIEEIQKQIDALRDREATPKKTATLRDSVAEPKPEPKKAALQKSSAKMSTWQFAVEAADTRYVVLVCRQTICAPCDRFEATALGGGKFSTGLTVREATLCKINLDEDGDARSKFPLSATPYIVVFDKSQNKWHGILADGKDTPGQALWRVDQCIAALNAPEQPKTRPSVLGRRPQ